ncbi:MAG: hypothetical protein RLY70_356 [Planctomycetota bacterium]
MPLNHPALRDRFIGATRHVSQHGHPVSKWVLAGWLWFVASLVGPAPATAQSGGTSPAAAGASNAAVGPTGGTSASALANPATIEGGQSTAELSQLAVEYVERFIAVTQSEQRQALGARDGAAGEGPEFNLLPGIKSLDPSRRKLPADVLLQNLDPLARRVDETAGAIHGRTQSIAKHWMEVRTALNSVEVAKAELLANKAIAGKLASLISLDNRWFWLATVAAVAVMSAVSWHERRHEYRRHLLGAKARAIGVARWLRYFLGLLIALTAVTFLAGDRIFHLLTHADGGADTASIDDLRRQVAELRARAESFAAAGNASATVRSPRPEPAGDGQDPEVTLRKTWQWLREETRETRVQLAVQRELSAALERDTLRLRLLVSEADQNRTDIAQFQSNKRWIRASMGGSLLAVVGGSAFVFFRGIRRRRRQNEETCPMCMAVGKIDRVTDGPATEMVRCSNVISENPFEECHFTFNSLYRDMTKLCFPTLGHPSSGKTHWLAMTYRELNQGNYPATIQFDKVRSDSSEDMDRIVDDLINSRLSTMATMVDRLPRPLLFNFRDYDRLGGSNLLVSIFDYSGEVLQRMTLNDPQRRRALDADGYLFFLDPTQRSEEQVKELIDFREDVRVLRKVRSGQALQAPVALCVSKIDLLINQEYADPGGTGPIGRFYKELEEIDPSGSGMSLEIVERRSDAIRRLRDTIWPGWQIEKQVHELFGGRCLFFPLTPVGLTELGVEDLGQRTIQPYGILDPLMWLLHMNGYNVLK